MINIASLFTALGVKLLGKENSLGFLLPKSLLRVRSYSALRKHLLAYEVRLIGDMGLLFEDVRGEQIALCLKKKSNMPGQQIAVDVFSKNRESKRYYASREFLEICDSWPTNLTELDEQIFWKLQKNTVILEEMATIFRGISIGANSPLISRVPQSPNDYPVLRGDSIGKFYLRYTLWLSHTAVNLLSDRKTERFQQTRIIAQNIFSRESGPIATLDTSSTLNLDTVTNIAPYDVDDSIYILGILNSKLAYYFLVQFVFAQSYLTMHLDAPYVGRIPISKTVEPYKIDLRTRIAAKTQEILRLSVDRNQIDKQKMIDDLDKLVFDLYACTEAEIGRISSVCTRSN